MDRGTSISHRHVRVPSLLRLEPADPTYPLPDGGWQTWAGGPALFEPPTPAPPLAYAGSLDVLLRPRLGLICSSHCPGTIALETYRIARNALPEGPSVIGGFHSPMERTVFDLLTVRQVPIVFCPGRRLNAKSIPVAWAPGIIDGRLLLVSPFGSGQRRVDRELAGIRNAFVGALAQEVFVPFARPGGAVALLVSSLVAQGRIVMTLADRENEGLMALGATAWGTDALIRKLRGGGG